MQDFFLKILIQNKTACYFKILDRIGVYLIKKKMYYMVSVFSIDFYENSKAF